jgi:hypothetical protein
MDKLFFSKDNLDLLNQIVSMKIKELHGININNISAYNKIMLDGMNYVYSNVKPNPPNGISSAKYLDMMNIKSLSVIIPKINDIVSNKNNYHPESRPQPQITNNRTAENINKKYELEQKQRFITPLQNENKNQIRPTNKQNDVDDQTLSLEESNALFNKKMQERGLNLKERNQLDKDNLEQFFPDMNTLNFGKQPESFQENDNNNFDTNFNSSMIHQETIKNQPYNPNSVNNTISPVIFPQKPEYIKKVQFFTIDSRDRDLEIYPNPSYFQVKFAPATDDIITQSINVKAGFFDIVYVLREDVSGERGATIPRSYENIFYLQCTQAIVPLESLYVCGTCPNRYYDNSVDSICQGATALSDRIIPVNQYSYQPIWNNKIGIPTTILDTPYLLLNIQELESYSPYCGTNTPNRNAFAKLVYDTHFGVLSPFIKMVTSDIDEFYTYSPTALSQLDKITLLLSTEEGDPFFFGRDKLFIERFERSPNFLKSCPSIGMEEGISATRVYISTSQTFCKCTKGCNCSTPLKSHCLKPGDLIYFYNTKPCKPVYVMFHNINNDIAYNNFRLIINDETENTINLSINIIINGMDDIEEPIDFCKFLSTDNYLVLSINNRNQFFNVIELDSTNITVNKNGSIDLMEGITISKVGYAKQNNKGFQTNIDNELTSKSGVRVCVVGDSSICEGNGIDCEPNCDNYDPNNPGSNAGIPINEDDPTSELYFDIDFPFDNIPPDFLGENYKIGQVFLIKQKLQISYTFKVVTLEKNYNTLESLLVGT